MKISIITPSFNSVRTIEKTILSVLNQADDLEYIIIDGGSTDGTVDVIKKYSDKLKYWVSEKDNGQSDAINKGFKIATGEIIAWLNADDYYEPDILNYIAAEFKKDDDIVMVYGKCCSIFDREKHINIPPVEINFKKLVKRGNLIYQPSSFYKRGAVAAVGWLDNKLNYWMEYDLYIKLLHHGEAKYIDKVLSNFTVREGQKSDLKNLSEMDEELLAVSKRYESNFLSKIYFSIFYHKLKFLFKGRCLKIKAYFK